MRASRFAIATLSVLLFLVPGANGHPGRWWWSQSHASNLLFLELTAKTDIEVYSAGCAGTGSRISRKADVVGPGHVSGGRPITPNSLYRHFLCVVVQKSGPAFTVKVHVLGLSKLSVDAPELVPR